MFEIKVDMMRIIERHGMLVFFGEQLPGATVAAVNDTLAEVREQAVSTLAGVVNAPRSEIDQRILVEPAARVSRIAASGSLYVSKSTIPLKRFGPRQVASGVAYSPTTGSKKVVRHAFGPNIPRLGNHVWRRTGSSRLPIEKVPGWSMFRSPVVRAAMNRVVSGSGEILQRNIDNRVGQFLTNLESGRTTFGPTYIDRTRGATFVFGGFRSIVTNNNRRR